MFPKNLTSRAHFYPWMGAGPQPQAQHVGRSREDNGGWAVRVSDEGSHGPFAPAPFGESVPSAGREGEKTPAWGDLWQRAIPGVAGPRFRGNRKGGWRENEAPPGPGPTAKR